jgi:hypothetical protein
MLVPLMLAAALAAPPAPPAPGPKVFQTAEDAAQALVEASQRQDIAGLEAILGSEAGSLVQSGDAVQDAARRERFVARAKEQLKVVPDSFHAGRFVVEVGKDAFPLPLPILKVEGGFRFDAAEAKGEILARHVGHNELRTISALREFAAAERDYAYLDLDKDGLHEYAEKLLSDPGTKNGLFWETAPGERESPLAGLVHRAAAEGYGPPAAGSLPTYHGYVFKILKGQGPNAPGGARDYVVRGKMMGGFAAVAFPAEYGVSGVKTFLVGHDGVVLEKDLGATTPVLAAALALFNPDKTWKEAPHLAPEVPAH